MSNLNSLSYSDKSTTDYVAFINDWYSEIPLKNLSEIEADNRMQSVITYREIVIHNI